MLSCTIIERNGIVGEEANKSDRFTFKLRAIASNVENCGLPFRVRDRLSGAIPILWAKSFNVMPCMRHKSFTVALKLTFISIYFSCKGNELTSNIN